MPSTTRGGENGTDQTLLRNNDDDVRSDDPPVDPIYEDTAHLLRCLKRTEKITSLSIGQTPFVNELTELTEHKTDPRITRTFQYYSVYGIPYGETSPLRGELTETSN